MRRYILHPSEFGYTVTMVEDDTPPKPADRRFTRYAPTGQEIAATKARAKVRAKERQHGSTPPAPTIFRLRNSASQ